MEETLREAAYLGNVYSLKKLLQSGVCVNSQNKMNGWTALHWSCKQGHTELVRCLLHNGADVNIRTHKGELPANLTDKEEILGLLPTLDEPRKHQESLPITPHFMMNPPFPYQDMTRAAVFNAGLLVRDQVCDVGNSTGCLTEKMSSIHLDAQRKEDDDQGLARYSTTGDGTDVQTEIGANTKRGAFLVKVRVADSDEKDFVEVNVENMAYAYLLHACCVELGLKDSEVLKIRKLPNVLVRKDKDVQRLNQGQEIELVLVTES